MKKALLYPLAAAAALLLALLLVAWPREQFVAATSPQAFAITPDNIARGAYLARAGDCMACHTERGGVAYAGGRALDTPFGRVYAPNITPDPDTGIGQWNADDFWRALHNGKSRDGRLLYPAFPYPNYTRVTREDADALFAYLRSLPAHRQQNRPHALRFPYNQQVMLAGWRLLYFKPGVHAPDTRRDAAWNRGAYLVEGLGHCSACHSSRNGLGATEGQLAGGTIPMLGWYAPPLTSGAPAGLDDWEKAHLVQLLKTGVSPRAAVFGPMAEVVSRSLQHLSDDDVAAMADYLKSLPAAPAARRPAPLDDNTKQVAERGHKLYRQHCADCHGDDGKGAAPSYPPLAGNRALAMDSPVNAIRMVLNGGFPPGTQGNPRPYGMPPYRHLMNDDEVAAVVTYLRTSWGHQAGAVSATQVNRYRDVPEG
ncbi:c-type cytochrome [Massilia horti]|uniref:Cytochrome c n=1 Tax=Massilia horti TaxID=2562153 RepID=A0A4Y9T159_9BURK|nr:cytochrome c [Massilia horti]TFW31596.1 cytochrome c [Massilia horti]TFW31611.1 cytochrome c [Massilia horti]